MPGLLNSMLKSRILPGMAGRCARARRQFRRLALAALLGLSPWCILRRDGPDSSRSTLGLAGFGGSHPGPGQEGLGTGRFSDIACRMAAVRFAPFSQAKYRENDGIISLWATFKVATIA